MSRLYPTAGAGIIQETRHHSPLRHECRSMLLVIPEATGKEET